MDREAEPKPQLQQPNHVPNRSEVPPSTGFQSVPDVNSMLPMMCPVVMPGYVPLQNQEQADHGPGIYAVPTNPYMGAFAGLPYGDLIPLKYNIPTRTNVAGVEQGQQGREHLGAQRQVVVRRFHFAIHIDLFLILKLVALVVLFNQEGSRQRLLMLLFFASLVYLHQTGVLAPFIRWLHRQAALPQPQPDVRADNEPLVGREDGDAARPEGQAENENQPIENRERPVEGENQAEARRENDGNWWGIAREIQMFVVGFITSLFPGFHPHNN